MAWRGVAPETFAWTLVGSLRPNPRRPIQRFQGFFWTGANATKLVRKVNAKPCPTDTAVYRYASVSKVLALGLTGSTPLLQNGDPKTGNVKKQKNTRAHLRVSPNNPVSGEWCGGRAQTGLRASLHLHLHLYQHLHLHLHLHPRRRHPRLSAPTRTPPWGFRLTRPFVATPPHGVCVDGYFFDGSIPQPQFAGDCAAIGRWCSHQGSAGRSGRRGRGRERGGKGGGSTYREDECFAFFGDAGTRMR